MAVAVPLAVPVIALILGNQLIELAQQIVLHVRVVVFVDGDGGGGVRDVDDGHPLRHPVLSRDDADLIGHIHDLAAPMRL
jgi:hypothetical protein